MSIIERPAALAALPASYGSLFDTAAAVFHDDERVRAMWLHGSLASGYADAASDLDISVAVADDGFDEFAGAWREWLAVITPTLTARPLKPGSFYAMTPSCERLDVISEPAGKLASSRLTRRIVVFDRDGLDALIPAPAGPRPNTDAITFLIEEELRMAVNFRGVLIRGDWLMGVLTVQHVHLTLHQLFAESNKLVPPGNLAWSTGPKHWSAKLTPYQREILERLPAAAPTPESVGAAREAALGVFFREAPLIAERTGVAWPAQLEHAVRAYLAEHGAPLPPAARRVDM
jgi:hypothetical protein